MKRYKFSDVPNDKKLSHFVTYYKLETYLAVFAVVVVGYLLYLALWAPKTDVSVLWVSGTYSLEADGIVNERLGDLDWDRNGDGKVTVLVQHAEFADSFENTDAESQIALMTILSAGDTDILFVSEAALEWGAGMGIWGTCGDFGGLQGKEDTELFSVECASLPIFRDSGIDAYEQMYVVIAKPREEPEALARYRRNMEYLSELLMWEN